MALLILSGDTGIGKTSLLFNQLLHRTDIGGFLSPLFDEKRNFYLIRSRQRIAMETEIDNDELVWKIGRYNFSRSSFEKAGTTLLSDWSFGLPLCLFDEFGPLEIQGKGLMPMLNSVIENACDSINQDLLVVVRTTILPQFKEKYDVKHIYDLKSISGYFKNNS